VKNALPFEAKGVALANAGEFQWGTSGHAGELADSGIYFFFFRARWRNREKGLGTQTRN